MFLDCYSITKINAATLGRSQLDYSVNHLFANCVSLEELDISGFDTSKVSTRGRLEMLAKCDDNL